MKGKFTVALGLAGALAAGFLLARLLEGETVVPVGVVETVPSPAAPATQPSAAPDAPGEPEAATPPGPTSIDDVMALEDAFGRVVAAHRLIEGADVAEVREHLAAGLAFPGSPDREAVLDVLFARLAVIDPAGVRATIGRAGGAQRDRRLALVYRVWAEADAEATLARVQALPPGGDRMIAQAGLMGALGHDRARLMQLMMAMWAPGRGGNLSIDLLDRARQDPLGALGEALELPDPQERRTALQQVATVWSETAPREALANADLIPDAVEQRQFRQTVIQQYAMREPERALSLLGELENRQDRDQLVRAVVGVIARSDVGRAMAIAEGIEDRTTRLAALQSAFGIWSQADPRSAAEALLLLDDPMLTKRFAQNVIWSYAQLAPREAMAWAEQVEGTTGELWQSAVTVAARSDPGLVLEVLAELPASPRTGELMASVLGSVASSDPQLAADEAMKLAPGPLRSRALRQIAQHWVQSDPEAALDWIVARSPREQEEIVGSAAYMVIHQDLELAIATTRRLAGRAREAWISAVVTQYAQLDPAGAASYVLGYPDEHSFGAWVGMIAAKLINIDPESALDLVEEIEDSKQRSSARQRLVHAWANVDPAGAAAWIADLPADETTPDLFANVARQWLSYAPEDATAWARAVVAPENRDAALGVIVAGQFVADELALTLLGEMRSEEKRLAALRSRLTSLGRHEPLRARALLDAAPLDDASLAELTALVDGWDPP